VLFKTSVPHPPLR